MTSHSPTFTIGAKIRPRLFDGKGLKAESAGKLPASESVGFLDITGEILCRVTYSKVHSEVTFPRGHEVNAI